MITEPYSSMMPDVSTRSMLNNTDFNEDFAALIREQRRQHEASERERELNIYRSGSAPPSVEGSLNAMGGLLMSSNSGNKVFVSEEDVRADPAYVDYYYNNVKMNPRLPPPLLSKEDWRFAQRLQRGGGDGNRSLFSVQPGFGGKEESGVEWRDDGLVGMPALGLGSRQTSFGDIGQDDMIHATSVSRNLSRPASRNAFNLSVENEGQFANLSNELPSMDALHLSANKPNMSAVRNIGSSASHSYASALAASLSRSTTPDPQLVARAPSPRIPPAGGGRAASIDKRSVAGLNSFNGVSLGINESADMVAALSNLSLSNGMVDETNQLGSQIQHGVEDQHNLLNLEGDQSRMKQHPFINNFEAGSSQRSVVSSANLYLKGSSTASLSEDSSSHYFNFDSSNSSISNGGLNGYVVNPVSPPMAGQLGNRDIPPFFNNQAADPAMGLAGLNPRAMGGLGLGSNVMTSAAELQNLTRVGNHATANALQAPPMDPLYLQYLMSNDLASAQLAALGPTNSRECIKNQYMDMLGLQKAYRGTLSSQQKSQRGLNYPGIPSGLNQGYYGNSTIGVGMSYPGSQFVGPLIPNSPVGLGSPMRHSDRNMRFNSMRNVANGVLGAWHSELGDLGESFGSSLLDEFKSNKTKCFELSEIAGHVVEFSADQYGSRFIQQKLETATADEKKMVFDEIMPQALTLMTDVFGNYVIQKFFEHGTAPQIKELANQLTGHVLNLSLQMYGCRVIQKAIEVVELDQQTEMVKELDGNVMRCVRDQNGNHVIQKCIECVPEDAIQFIVSTFYDQVVVLSTHPYGCRVIQRVLEHCHDPKTQRVMMDEIMQSVCMLAQDQYGNYVVQHVLEHGKPDERSAIIEKLTGQIIQMSQQKFASNVIEKCLTFGTPEERQILVNEMLGSTDENEPLQVMMKDQFANYVVQKVLETCDDQQLELILNRIKVHLNALKKYTYGKHIVARVEKLVAAGERRISFQTTNAAA